MIVVTSPAVDLHIAALRWRGVPIAIALLLSSAGPVRAQDAAPPVPGRLLAKSGTDLEARADGPACAPRVKVIITAKDAKLFEGDIPPAAKFFTNARAGHSLSCPQMNRMVAQGKSEGKTMFTAMADKSSGWEALMLGASSGDSRAEDAALASGGPTPKSVLRSNPAFVPSSQVLAQTQDKFLCLSGSTLVCEVILKFTSQGNEKATIAYRQALSGGKAAAAVTSTANLRDGFFCADPQTSVVTVEDPQMSEDARKDYAEQLLERVRSNGEICTGFSGRIDAMTAYGFDGTGKGVDKARQVKLFGTMPGFGGAR
ncbi:MAG: hypothetical protein IV093_16960 [Rubrivivax sp.]|nr:hypothetical protein [Rubrivivax sp.]